MWDWLELGSLTSDYVQYLGTEYFTGLLGFLNFTIFTLIGHVISYLSKVCSVTYFDNLSIGQLLISAYFLPNRGGNWVQWWGYVMYPARPDKWVGLLSLDGVRYLP